MKQLTQKLSDGEMEVQTVPEPRASKGQIVVKNHYSLISAGTEGSTVKAARKSLIGKAKERPQQLKQVFETLKQKGPIETYRAVNKKLDSYSPLGYSSAGEVIEVGEGVKQFQVGDRVACAGVGYANHAEIVSVPENLCVKLPENADLKSASYNTLGAIAMQSVRQADLRLGESCVVIGLGLLGQLTSLILKASGVQVIGIDISDEIVYEVIEKDIIDVGFCRQTSGIEKEIEQYTNGIGADGVIIAAATESKDPINFAGAIARKKGTVVILGDVPTGFERNPHWYRKELELKMSCSYGPGRYDLNYEEKGIDYPVGYVRWTEQRNMKAFQELLASGKIQLDSLTTHEFSFKDAPKAYDLVVNRHEPYTGIVLKYDVEKTHRREKVQTNSVSTNGSIKLSFIGAGSYAQSHLLPNIPDSDKIIRSGVLTNSGTSSKRVAEKFTFKFCTSDEEDLFDESTNTFFIATRHDSHGRYVLEGLKRGNHVFVEKPLCLNEEELSEIVEAQKNSESSIMVGFNRRFSSLSVKAKTFLKDGPMSMIYRVNAGAIPKDSWIQDRDIGGGRIIGEVCHFIDYLTFLNGSVPVSVSAQAVPDPHGLNDTVNIMIEFENGSSGVVAYYANGSKGLPKEYIEVFSSGSSVIIEDFKKVTIWNKGKTDKKRLFNQDKGQKQMVETFMNHLLKAETAPISFNEIIAVTRACFKVNESLKQGGNKVSL